MNIIYFIIPSGLLLLFLLFILFKKMARDSAKKNASTPTPASTPTKFESKPCQPTTGEIKRLGANYMTTEEGKCSPTSCMSGFVKNQEGQCVVMRKYNWLY
jgi:hypothetical protein